MDWLYFILFEIVAITAFGAAGTYLIWQRKRETIYGDLLNKYGYIIGVVGAVLFSLALVLFFI